VHERKPLVLGVGNRSRGDDAAGSALTARLAGRLQVPVLDASDVPENYLGPIEASGADLVVLVDAADFGGKPGDLAVLELAQLGADNFATHAGSLSLLLKAIPAAKRPEAFLLAIQPRSNCLGAPISEPVHRSMQILERVFVEAFGSADCAGVSH
jgi:hydrogenase 3 maturation protease